MLLAHSSPLHTICMSVFQLNSIRQLSSLHTWLIWISVQSTSFSSQSLYVTLTTTTEKEEKNSTTTNNMTTCWPSVDHKLCLSQWHQNRRSYNLITIPSTMSCNPAWSHIPVSFYLLSALGSKLKMGRGGGGCTWQRGLIHVAGGSHSEV